MSHDKWSRWLDDERWGDNRDSLQSALNAVRDRILSMADIQPGQRVLDLGAGTGLLGLEAAHQIGYDGQVFCVDISAAALQTGLVQADSGNVEFVAGDVLHIPLSDQSVDTVVIRSVLSYVQDRLASAQEISRVLRPGGRLVEFEPINRRMPWIVQLTGFEDVEAARERSLDQNPLTNFDEFDLRDAFVAAGFASVDFEMTETRWPANGKVWAHTMRHGAPRGYCGYDTLIGAGLSPERVDEFLAAGERHLGDDRRVHTCPAVYLIGKR
jgi:SAM-dependent methyltransferase